MNPMRFYLVFDVEGNASDQLSRLSTQFIELGAAGTAAGGRMESFHGTVIAAIHGLRQLEEVGHAATEMGYGLLSVLGQLSASVLQNAQEFESLETRMSFAFGDRSQAVWAKTQEYAVESAYQFNEVAGVIGQLGIAIPAVADEFARLPESYLSRHGEMIDALHVLGDTASGTGRSFQMVSYEVRQMMAGVWRGAHQVLNLTHQETDTIKHAIQSTTDTAVQFSTIMQVLASHYGGATSSMEHTLAFLRLQLPDIAQVIQARIGQGGLRFIREGVSELIRWLRELPQNTQFIESLAGAFGMVAETGGKALKVVIAIGREVVDFVSHHPEAVKMAVVLTAIVGTLGVLGGTVLAVTAGMGVFMASMTLAGSAIFSVMGMTTLAIGGATAGVAALVAAGAMLSRAYESNLGGLRTRFDQVRLVVVALSEALQNWNGDMTYISLDTASKLQNAGILDFFVNMVSWIRRAQEWWVGFVAGLEAGFQRINWGGIRDGLRSIESSLASVGITLHLLDSAADTSFDTMREKGYTFANVLNHVIVPGLNLLIDLFRGGAWVVENGIVPGISAAAHATDALMRNWDAVRGVLFAAALILYPIPAAILGIISMTNSWKASMQGVLAVFQTIQEVVGFIGDVTLGLGRGINAIGRGFAPPSSIPESAPSTYSSFVESNTGENNRRSYNPFENGGPTYVHDTGGASTEQAQTPIQVRMTQAGSGNLTPTGNLPGTDLAALAQRIQENTEAIRAANTRTPAPQAPSAAPPTRAPRPDLESVIDALDERRGSVSGLPGRR